MTTPPSNTTRSGPVQRYGPLTGIIVAILLVAALVTFAGREPNTATTASAGSGSGSTNGGGGDGAAEAPITYEQAKQDGRAGSIQWVENCDPATGRIKMPTVFALPCVPRFSGDNGGDTAPGVTRDRITVVYYVPAQNGDIMAQLQGNIDPPEAGQETIARFSEMLGDLAETYGRTVDLKVYQSRAPGGTTDPVTARAEAQEVIDQFHPFASIGGPALSTAYAEELAAQGVVCLGCGGSTSDETFQANAPHMWGAQMTPEQWLQTVSEYIGKRLAKRPARWAGDPELAKQTRKFGVVNFEQDPPVFSTLSSVGEQCEELSGWRRAVQEKYLITTMNDRAPTIIAKLKAEGITSVIFMGDPIMPIALTNEATKQNYFPEWIVTGTVFTDSSTLARRYDQRQWAHAFGLSQLAVYLPPSEIDAWRLHVWYFGTKPKAEKTSQILWPGIFQLYNGLHMAGPNLTPESFAQGLFNLPPAGGTPTAPRVSYGNRGTFSIADPQTCTAEKKRTDYLGVDDMVEIWWDPNKEAPDEQGTMGRGKYWYANGGKRYLPGQMPETEADAFKTEGAVVGFDKRPPAEEPPQYPSPRR